MKDRRSEAGSIGGAPIQRSTSAPGKRTLTAAVQRKASVAANDGAGDASAIAAAGTDGAGGTLPHLDAIQASFGPHDVSGIQAHVGGAAAEASEALGAEAYASGDRVAFSRGPDLHTAAHEAAHVVQQRAGVQLKGGLGETGDLYEQNADAVADRVVAGQSAVDLLPQGVGTGFAGAPPVQRLAKVQAAGRRTALDLSFLNDDELQGLITQLESGAAQPFTITYDAEENANQLLARVRTKLASRQNVTGPFNVRGRAVASTGVVFSDDNSIREVATGNGLSAYPADNEAEVRAVYGAELAAFTLLMDQPALGRTKYYGPASAQRGPRADAAAPSGREQMLYAPSTTVTSTLTLTDVCKRGDTSASRDGAMGNASARNYAHAVIGDVAHQHSWEWLHLVGSAIGGGNTLGNLVAGTYDMNTLMIPLEQTIVEYAAKHKPTAQSPMVVTATATLHQATNGPSWVAESITLKVDHGGSSFWLGPIRQKVDQMTHMEFDFYRHIFQRMANL